MSLINYLNCFICSFVTQTVESRTPARSIGAASGLTDHHVFINFMHQPKFPQIKLSSMYVRKSKDIGEIIVEQMISIIIIMNISDTHIHYMPFV